MQSIQSTLTQLVSKVNAIEENVSRIDNIIEKSSNVLEKSVKEINDSVTILKENVIQHLLDENKRLNEKIKNIENDIKILSEKVVEIERSVAKTDQYDRRNNVEFHGIPNDVEDNKLKEKSIDICKAIDVEIDSDKIEACHRFGRGDPKKVIIRLVNRKDCDKIKSCKRKLRDIDFSKLGLGDNTIYIQDNLSPYFSELAWKCRKVKELMIGGLKMRMFF